MWRIAAEAGNTEVRYRIARAGVGCAEARSAGRGRMRVKAGTSPKVPWQAEIGTAFLTCGRECGVFCQHLLYFCLAPCGNQAWTAGDEHGGPFLLSP